jgi:protein SCO1
MGFDIRSKRCVIVAAMIGCLFVISCRRIPEQRYELKGKVVSVDKAQRQVTIAHEPIKGFMDAMTMPFDVKDDWALPVLAPGQVVEATLVVQEDRSWIEGLRISQGPVAEDTDLIGSMPKIGDEVPDFRLLNQDGKEIHLAQYRGRPLLLTFIYTRCPLPDFCPRTSMTFAAIHRAIPSLADISRKPHLLTISFDTEHDTPSVLREYAARYMNPPDFGSWEFATGSEDDIRAITGYFGLSYRKESGQITHTLVTAMIGADGKLAHLYLFNKWTSDRILADLK